MSRCYSENVISQKISQINKHWTEQSLFKCIPEIYECSYLRSLTFFFLSFLNKKRNILSNPDTVSRGNSWKIFWISDSLPKTFFSPIPLYFQKGLFKKKNQYDYILVNSILILLNFSFSFLTQSREFFFILIS